MNEGKLFKGGRDRERKRERIEIELELEIDIEIGLFRSLGYSLLIYIR